MRIALGQLAAAAVGLPYHQRLQEGPRPTKGEAQHSRELPYIGKMRVKIRKTSGLQAKGL